MFDVKKSKAKSIISPVASANYDRSNKKRKGYQKSQDLLNIMGDQTHHDFKEEFMIPNL